MNPKYLIAILAALAAPAISFAQSAPATQSETAPAKAQPVAARNVHICQNEAECDAAPHRDFTVTRAQVLAELYRARAAGEIPETEADNDIGHSLQRRRAK